MEIPTRPDFLEYEPRLYKFWEDRGYFRPQTDPKKKSFSIILPPPNANAELHLGNALFVIEDILIRYHRMQGDATLWVPGIDHAGILSQAVFERKLKKEQEKTRFDLGREEFYKQIYQFCLDNKTTIENQLRAMGFSLDWTREKFTLDPKVSQIVLETFVKLYKDRLIYRGERMINWCIFCHTTLSDLETEEKEREDQLYYLDYGIVTIATTRPETIFADSAVAVNPKDKKYKKLVGQFAIIPLINKRIPIIADSAVEMGFGTDALKVTPGHDPIDFEIGERHKLEKISVIDFEGKMNLDFADLKGLSIKAAREKTVAMLQEQNKLIKTEPLKHSVKTCERCKNIIEPLISRQWFVHMTPLAEQGIAAVKKGKIKFIPQRWLRQYNLWMKNLHDWPVSRQIWWGHQLPVFYCASCQNEAGKKSGQLIKENSPFADPKTLENPIVSVRKPQKCPKCKSQDIIQDPDTFDTWFSSGQWPFTTLMTGQPNDFKRFYPTNVLDTGWEIFWLWVTRMIMFGLYVKNDVPFKNALIHGMLRDEKGQKMSKSKGNGVDPLEMIKKYGADAVRLALVASRDVTADWMISKNQLEQRIAGYRNFTTKIWNIARFLLLSENKAGESQEKDESLIKATKKLVKEVTSDLNKFKLGNAAEKIYQFSWHEFADGFVEDYKKGLVSYQAMLSSFQTILKLLHPFMPYITEEIFQILRQNGLPIKDEALIISPWPKR